MAGLQARHATALRSYALELWNGNNRRADESLAALWRDWAKAPPTVDGGGAREALFAALRRQIVAAQRGAGLRAEIEQDGETEPVADRASATERVAQRFRQLTPKQQEALRLRLRHGFGPDEIAHITELSHAAVEQLIHHALGRLDGSSIDEPRIARLALNGATAEDVAAESPADRARVAELRLTAEVARQVLARGVETFVTPKKRRSRRTVFALVAVAVAALAGAAFFLVRSRAPAHEPAASAAVAVTGAARVAIARTESKKEFATSPAAPGEPTAANGGTGLTPRRSGRAAPAASAGLSPGQKAPPAADAGRATANTLASTSASPAQAHVDAPTRTGAPTGEVGRAEPAAQRRGETSAEKIGAPPAQPLGRATAVSAPPAPEDGDRGLMPPRSERDAPAASQNSPAARQSPPTAPAPTNPQALPGVESAPHATVNAQPLAADRIDTAPIAALRKALGASRWPEPRQVNVRALVNAAPPAAATVSKPDAEILTARVESSASPLHPKRQLVRVELRARETAPAPRAPATVILLLDVSGSMDAPNRLPLVQEAVAALLRRLRPEDRVGIVTYAGESRVLLPPAPLTDESAVRAAVDALDAKGRTNGGAGLREAFALAAADGRGHGEHLVLLCTDGNFNMGETSEAELGALIDRHRDAAVRLAIFGFGRPDRIDARLEALAARARGGSGYVNTRAEAEQALVSQLEPLFAPVAERLEASVEFDPARVARYRALGEAEMRVVAPGAPVPLASQERVLPGEALSALFEIERTPAAARDPAAADLRVRAACVVSDAAGQKNPRYGLWPARLGDGSFAAASVDFRFAAAMAAFGEALQAGPEEGATQLDEVARWARAAVGEDAGGYRAELVATIEQARRAAGR